MIGWLIFIVYIAGVFWSVPRFARRMLESMERDFPNLLRSEEDYRKESTSLVLYAIFPGIFWPGWWACLGIWNLVDGKALVETDRYKLMRQRRELEELRYLAREHNLPLPEIDR